MVDSVVSDGAFQDRIVRWLTVWDQARIRRLMVTLLGVLSGLLLGLVLDAIFRAVGNNLFPPPILFELAPEEQKAELMNTADPAFFMIELTSWFLGAFGGGYIAERVAKRGGYPAWAVGFFMGIAAIIIMTGSMHPTWVKLVSLPLIALGAYGAGFVAVLVNAGRLQAPPKRPRKPKPARVALTEPMAVAEEMSDLEADPFGVVEKRED